MKIRPNVFLVLVFQFGLSLWGATQNKETDKIPVYDTPLHFALDFQYIPLKYKSYVYTGTTSSDKTGFGGRLGFDWMPFIGRFGKVGIGLGVGGGVVDNVDLGNEQFASLVVYAVDVFVSYRLDLIKNQILVPYVKAGTEATFTTQTSKTGLGRAGYRTYSGIDYAGGLELCLNTFEPSSGYILDSNTGINGMYLMAEYFTSGFLGTEKSPNLKHSEFRFGLRAEF